MSYKTILVHIDVNEQAAERIRIAIDIAKQNDAHLIGLAVSATLVGPVIGAMDTMGTYALDLLEFQVKQAKDASLAFETIAAAAGLKSFESRIDARDAATAVRQHARYADLVIVGQTDKDTVSLSSPSNLPQCAVLETATPVLIVPYVGVYPSVGQHVFLLWNATAESARAARDALPFLKGAKDVRVSVFDSKGGLLPSEQKPDVDARHFFARHGVKITMTQDSSDGDIGSAVLSRVADHGADLIVMGGYGHSRLREWMLGGVSKTMLDHMTVPVLMSH